MACVGEEGEGRSRRKDSLIVILGTKWRWVVSLTCQLLYPGQTAPNAHWICGWVNRTAGLDALEKRKISCLDWRSNPRSPSLQPIRNSCTKIQKVTHTPECDAAADRLNPADGAVLSGLGSDVAVWPVAGCRSAVHADLSSFWIFKQNKSPWGDLSNSSWQYVQ